jgi:hypothetical protein
VDLSTSAGEEHQLQHRSSLLQTLSINPYKNPEFRRAVFLFAFTVNKLVFWVRVSSS